MNDRRPLALLFRPRAIVLLVLGCVLCGTLHALHVRFGYLLYSPAYFPAMDNMEPLWKVIVWFIWRYGMLVAMLPLFAGLVRRYPPGGDWRSNVRVAALYVAASPLLASLSLILGALIFHLPPFQSRELMSLDNTARELLAALWFQHFFFCNVVLAVLAVGMFQEQLRERERRTAALRTQTVEARLQALQHQLQPHFLFNSLHAVTSLIGHRPDQATEMVGRISEFLQLVLDRGQAVQGPLSAELTLLDRYLAIESVRFSDRLRVEQRIDPAARDCLVPTLLLQPLAENAIRHGISRRAEPGTLRVSAQLVGERLLLEVEDDGPGPAGSPTGGGGTGLHNTRERLAAWCGAERFELALKSGRGGGTCVSIVLPARRQSAPEPGFPASAEPALEPAYA